MLVQVVAAGELGGVVGRADVEVGRRWNWVGQASALAELFRKNSRVWEEGVTPPD